MILSWTKHWIFHVCFVLSLIAAGYIQFVNNVEKPLDLENPEASFLWAGMTVFTSGLYAEDDKSEKKGAQVVDVIAKKGTWVLKKIQWRGDYRGDITGTKKGYGVFFFHSKNPNDSSMLLVKVWGAFSSQTSNSHAWSEFSLLKVGDDVLFVPAFLDDVPLLLPTPFKK